MPSKRKDRRVAERGKQVLKEKTKWRITPPKKMLLKGARKGNPKAQEGVQYLKQEPSQQTTLGTHEKCHSGAKSQRQRKNQKTKHEPRNNPRWHPLP